MLFPYIYVPHQMEKMQEFIDFIFYAVWCKARKRGKYGLHLFAANAKLYAVIKKFHYSDTKGAYFFNRNIESIYKEFQNRSPYEIRRIQRWYKGNNDVEWVCANDPRAHLAKYEDIKKVFPDLEELIGSFFKGLYDRLDIAALKDKIGDIDSHYDEFVKKNDAGKCPFCGLNDLLTEYNSKREAYDHYLPKALYPFNSTNFRNLVPACHHCNSSYKSSKDPAYTPKDPAKEVKRRAVFYPFMATAHSIDLQITLQHSDITRLTPEDITLQLGPAVIAEEIHTWKDVYGIEERYTSKLCGKNDGKYWLTQILDEWKQDGRRPADFLKTLARHTQMQPYADCNFLRRPFLEAFQRMGVFDEANQT